VVYYRASSNGDVQKEMEAFVGLHQMRWEQKGLGGCFKSQRFLEFHKEVSEIFSRRGWAHLDFLILDGEKVAGIYGYSYKGKYYFYLPGLNPEIFPETSPGTLLLFQCICQAIRDGCEEFDLLRGPADYKMAWANGLRRSMTLKLYNKTIRAAASKFIKSGKEIVKVLVR
jgi:CelD/BcsL family acetyltransferase involved in cellulose biosynthesis